MTFSRCVRCDATFNTSKRDQHQCQTDQQKEPTDG